MPINISKSPDVLPSGAKAVYVNAFNAANKADADSAISAWSAVKGKYQKTETGWIEKTFSDAGLRAEGVPLPGSLAESPFTAGLTWIAAFQERYENTRDLAEASSFAWDRLKAAYVQNNESGLWMLKSRPTFEEALEQVLIVVRSVKCHDCNELALALRIDLPEGTQEALCEKFGDAEGFRTRCMPEMEGKVDDAGAFCNSLKIACHGSSAEERSALVGRPFGGFEDWDECVEKFIGKGKDQGTAEAICGKIKADTEKSLTTRDFDWDACVSEQRESGKSFEEANDACDAKKNEVEKSLRTRDFDWDACVSGQREAGKSFEEANDICNSKKNEAELDLEAKSFEIKRLPAPGTINGGAIVLDGLTEIQEYALLTRGFGGHQAACPKDMNEYEWIARTTSERTVQRVIADKRRSRAYQKRVGELIQNYSAIVRGNPSGNGEMILTLPARIENQNQIRRYSGVLTRKSNLTGFESGHWQFRAVSLDNFRGSLTAVRMPPDEIRFRGPVLK